MRVNGASGYFPLTQLIPFFFPLPIRDDVSRNERVDGRRRGGDVFEMRARNIDQDRNRYRLVFLIEREKVFTTGLSMAHEGRLAIQTVIDAEQTPSSFISNRPSGSGETRIGHSVRRLVAAKDIPKKSSGSSKKFVLLEHHQRRDSPCPPHTNKKKPYTMYHTSLLSAKAVDHCR